MPACACVGGCTHANMCTHANVCVHMRTCCMICDNAAKCRQKLIQLEIIARLPLATDMGREILESAHSEKQY